MLENLRAQLDSGRSDVKGGDQKPKFWKPNPGENVIRIMPFTHVVTELDLEMERINPETPVGTVLEMPWAPRRTHFNPKKQNCGKWVTWDGRLLGECAYCDAAEAKMASDDKSERDVGYDRRASIAFTGTVLDLTDGENFAYQSFDFSNKFAGWLGEKLESRIYKGVNVFGKGGMDILWYCDPKKPNNAKHSFDIIPKEQTTQVDWKGVRGFVNNPLTAPWMVPDQFQDLLESCREAQKAHRNKGKEDKGVKSADAPTFEPGATVTHETHGRGIILTPDDDEEGNLWVEFGGGDDNEGEGGTLSVPRAELRL